jgi:tRNA 5-methylaminomethyl-2-thiouridine biosynthesis bifunctional protein
MHAGPMKVTPPPSPPPSREYFSPPRAKSKAATRDVLDPGLIWKDMATPVSERFGDIYYAGNDGLEAARRVFLGGNDLPEAWSDRDCFVIGETGFGTGRNFLTAWNAWRRTARPGARLHYLAVEKYPLSREELSKCLAPWVELAPLASDLLAVYPTPRPGFQRVWLDGGRVALTLMIGDAVAVLAEAEARVDAWFLDGFSPARNPDMWSPEVFSEIARLSAPGASFATFTPAEEVRDGLSTVGFTTEKQPGSARGHEMLTGRITGTPPKSRIPPWYRPPPPITGRDGTIAILGAGIAGCAAAHALARRDRRAVLVDRHARIAAEASGNPSALIAPRPEQGGTDGARFHDAAFRMARAAIATSDIDWDATGALRLLNGDEADSQAPAKSRAEASDLAGIALDIGGQWFPDAGSVDPAAYAGFLGQGATRLFSRKTVALEAGAPGWRLMEASGAVIAEAETLIITASHGSSDFSPLSWLPLIPILGQLSEVPETPESAGLSTALIRGGYLTPSRRGRHILGATHERTGFDPLAWPQPVTHAAHDWNHQRMPPEIRALLDPPETGHWSGRAAMRCSTPDHLPVIGPVVMESAFLDDFDRLPHGPRGVFPTEPAYHPGLYVMTGFGSRGIMTAAIAAELMVSQMLGEPWPVERRVALALAPTRFLTRHLGRPGRPTAAANLEAE